MRLGIVSDVHGNLPALEAALAALRRQGVDAYVQLGDLVGYGPFPNECIEAIAELDAVGVVGNHELILLERLPPDNCWRLAQETLAWTRSVLSADSRAYIESLPSRATPAQSVVATHASLRDPETYVVSEDQAAAQLAELRRQAPGADLLLIGHTHRARAYSVASGEWRLSTGPLPLEDEKWLLNPGSVGQSRQRRPRATCMVLDLGRREATLLSLEYDVERTRRELRRHGLDPRAHHSAPSPLALVRRVAGAAFGRRR